MSEVQGDYPEEDFDTIMSADIDFTGTLSFEKPFMIRGRLTGDIDARELLVVDEEAVVEANIRAPRVVIRGSVKGNVIASEKVEVTLSGRLEGNVDTPEIFMESGCLFNGRCTMPKPS